ncbi:MAG: DUF1861 family protein [Mycoplasmatales bacterium]
MKILDLLNTYENKIIETSKLNFYGVDGFDVYNLTAPFKDEEKIVLAGRVEKRDSEHSKIMFFEEKEANKWYLLTDYPEFILQDPYCSVINGELLLGGTEIFDHPTIPDALSYCAVKLRGANVKSLKPFFRGPNGMKDIRLVQVSEKEILLLTRPQGGVAGPGKVGYVILNSLDELTIDACNNAALIELFDSKEWGGGNEAHMLSNGLVGVLGHVARFDDEGNRHYHSCVFTIDLKNNTHTMPEIICVRDNLNPGESKRPDLEDVLFSGGIIRHNDGTASIYNGVGDCESHVALIPDPFLKYEEK